MDYSILKKLTNKNLSNLYIGKGNPNGTILFIGKEAAIDQQTNQEAYIRDIKKNNIQWIQNIEEQVTLKDIQNWAPLYLTQNYNPLYPYKGQLNKIESRDNLGNIIRGKGGTSSTWFYYQKIIDAVFFDHVKSEYINFHEKAFLTELSEASAKYSKDVDKHDRQLSLTLRQEFLTHEFYQNFPIVIVAAGHYVRNHQIDIEKIFNVKYDSETGVIPIGKSNFINIHYDDINQPKKLVIHTNQLSMGISNELIKELSSIIKDFLIKTNTFSINSNSIYTSS
ncbi:hypothetical protein HX030_05000 [Myroides odoratimimus]|uniref:hypothetical protein n=1 Tax=Myroides TaxID=76831 RepID=UPI000585DB2B|nr:MULTISPECIES: hypothetical protein [Myroides]AJA70502.1 hypothetical protein MYRA21_3411 [Myroides sp. A21]MCA4807564.1 hypothetical protein [Myroides odoratimimus]MCS7474674.1 hypothetical protein [Myroides odoratimimus]MDM1093471.1 hypothetical protein [Myroides odoratimimus]MDM1328736.1 hypothetical protein [Myroides odoratimimus]